MGNHVFRIFSVCLAVAPAILLISCQHAIPLGKHSLTADPLSEYELSGESNEVNTALRLWGKLIIEDSPKANGPVFRSADGSIVDCFESQLTPKIKKAITNENSVRWVRIVSDSDQNTDLSWIKNAKSLKGLSLRNFREEGFDVEVLAQMTGLRWLDLRGTNLLSTNRSVLLDLRQVEIACLGSTRCSDQQLRQFGFSQTLRILGVPACDISDEAISHIAKTNTELTVLDVSWCPNVSSASLREIPKLTKLRTLWVLGMPLAKEHAKLRKTMPECEIRALD